MLGRRPVEEQAHGRRPARPPRVRGHAVVVGADHGEGEQRSDEGERQPARLGATSGARAGLAFEQRRQVLQRGFRGTLEGAQHVELLGRATEEDPHQVAVVREHRERPPRDRGQVGAQVAVGVVDERRTRARPAVARMNASSSFARPPKCRYTVATPTPASSATRSMVAPARPRSATTRRAASMMPFRALFGAPAPAPRPSRRAAPTPPACCPRGGRAWPATAPCVGRAAPW